MTFTGVEWIVLVFALLGLVKLLVIMVSRKRWLPVINEVYDHPTMFSWIFFLLAAIVFYILIQEMSIVQIVACMALTALVMGLAMLHYGRDIKSLAKKMITSKIDGWLWIYIIVWLALLIWAIWSIIA